MKNSKSAFQKTPGITLFSLGYQGLSLSAYCELLKETGINLVLDVRQTAWSRKPGFSKGQMETALQAVGIRYLHAQFLGNPIENRKSASSVDECLELFREHLRARPKLTEQALEIIEEAARNDIQVCLTCFEGNYNECHRSVIIEELAATYGKLTANHLSASSRPKAPEATKAGRAAAKAAKSQQS